MNSCRIMDISIITYSVLSMWLFRVTYLTSMCMYLNLMSDMALFTCSFIVVKSDVGVMTSPVYSMRFTPAEILFLWFSFFVVWCNILLSHRFLFCIFVCLCEVLTLLFQFLHFFIPGTGGQVHCTLSFSIPVHPFLPGLCIPKTFLQSQSGCGFLLVTL